MPIIEKYDQEYSQSSIDDRRPIYQHQDDDIENRMIDEQEDQFN